MPNPLPIEEEELVSKLMSIATSEDSKLSIVLDLPKLLELVKAHSEQKALEAVESYKTKNHIGYAYEPGEVTDNYIVLERIVKKGKNWVLSVMCRWCGNKMNRMTNKFSKRHLDCPSWGIHSKLTNQEGTNNEL